MPTAKLSPGKGLLSPNDHVLAMIDYQPQMAFPVKSIDMSLLRNNVAMVAESAKLFNVNTILTTAGAKTFAGPAFPEIIDVFGHKDIFDRSSMNCFEDQTFIDALNKHNKNRIVMCGLWTSVCISDPALSAIDQGFEVYVITDACGDISREAHKMSLERMIQAGVRPITSLTYLLELQRDWARTKTYTGVLDIAQRYGGAYGTGIYYAHEMLGGAGGAEAVSGLMSQH